MAVRSKIQEILEDNKGKKFSIPDLAKIEDILLRSQKSALSQVEDINNALAAINKIRSEGGSTPKKKYPPPDGKK